MVNRLVGSLGPIGTLGTLEVDEVGVLESTGLSGDSSPEACEAIPNRVEVAAQLGGRRPLFHLSAGWQALPIVRTLCARFG